jgi:hypothetical protein
MSERYGIKAYWGHRPESAEACARRAETFFRLLAECHPDFARWYERAGSARKALQLGFEPTRETFLSAGRRTRAGMTALRSALGLGIWNRAGAEG